MKACLSLVISWTIRRNITTTCPGQRAELWSITTEGASTVNEVITGGSKLGSSLLTLWAQSQRKTMESLKLISLCSTHDSHELIRHKGFFSHFKATTKYNASTSVCLKDLSPIKIWSSISTNISFWCIFVVWFYKVGVFLSPNLTKRENCWFTMLFFTNSSGKHMFSGCYIRFSRQSLIQGFSWHTLE